MNQLNFLDGPIPAANAATTRRAAAASIRTDAASLRGKVLGFLILQGDTGSTDEEIQTALGMSGNTERPRRKELEQLGLVRDSGQVRATKAGRAACVWCAIAPLGKG